MDELRELLLSLPISQVTLSVFLSACVFGGVCTVTCSALRALPDALKDLRCWRLDRRGVIEREPAWIKEHADAHRGND
ncbi:MAG: hypothetical protein ACXWCY_27400 [Burkholderiales bacterium]